MNGNRLARRGYTYPHNIFDWFWSATLDDIGSPRTVVTPTDAGHTIELAAPGAKKSDFNVDVKGDILSVSLAETSSPWVTPFEKSWRLNGAVVHGDVKATYTDGVLKIVVPTTDDTKRSCRVSVT